MTVRFPVTVLRKNLLLQHLAHDQWYGTEDHWIWTSRNQGKTWEKLCKLKPAKTTLIPFLKESLLRSCTVRYFRKNIGIHNLSVLDSGTIIIQYDKIYRFAHYDRYAVPVFDFHPRGIYGPLKNGICYDRATGNLYFGEYVNKRPHRVKIVRGTDDGKNWKVCYQFASGRIRHVHGIYSDPFRQRLWICTGDNDNESGLYFTDDDFQTVHLYGGGDQSWRMVSLLTTEDGLIWGTDAGQDAPGHIKNYIYRLDIRTGLRERLCCIDKPAYYSFRLADGSMYIATTYEPGIQRNVQPSADLWHSTDTKTWKMICSFPYKPSGRNYGTKYATLFLPTNESEIHTCCGTPVNVQSFDFCALKIN